LVPESASSLLLLMLLTRMRRLIWVFSLQMARDSLGTPACERNSVPATADGDCGTGGTRWGQCFNAALVFFSFLVGAALLLGIDA
jgi:hypothetical protein